MKKFSVNSHLRKAKSLVSKGEIDNAKQLYNEILGKFPNNINAKAALSNLSGKDVENLVELYNGGNFLDVINKAKPLMNIMSTNEIFWNVLGASYQALGLPSEAHKAFVNVLKCNSKSANGYNNLGCALKDLGHTKDAKKYFEKALSLDPTHQDAYFNLGLVLHLDWDLQGAIIAYQKSIEINPSRTQAIYHLGHALQYAGNTKEAISTYYKVLELEPENCDAIRNLSDLITFDNDHPITAKVFELLHSKNIPTKSKAALHFTYAKIHDDLKEYPIAFEHFKIGGQIRKKSIGYHIQRDIELFEKIKFHFAKSNLKKSVELSVESSLQPIFILGMPRSGTSLVEQIVSAHSKVAGCGELKKINQLASKILENSEINIESSIEDFRSEYLEFVNDKIGETKIFTDKMPSNFLHIGMILTAFPEAKILHCVRDARAICWSNFRNYYSQNSIPWSYDLDDVVTYYGLYSNLMSFWKNIFGEKIYDVNYEALVTEPDGEIKKIISHIGLPWEETCLSPHKNNRIVGTASSNQVKNKIYQGSSEIWKNYLSHLERSFDVLPETV